MCKVVCSTDIILKGVLYINGDLKIAYLTKSAADCVDEHDEQLSNEDHLTEGRVFHALPL